LLVELFSFATDRIATSPAASVSLPIERAPEEQHPSGLGGLFYTTMPALVDHFDYDGDGNVDFDDVTHAAKMSWNSFWEFALRDNVLEVALGLMCVQKDTLKTSLQEN
jgi:hypothetical protein